MLIQQHNTEVQYHFTHVNYEKLLESQTSSSGLSLLTLRRTLTRLLNRYCCCSACRGSWPPNQALRVTGEA